MRKLNVTVPADSAPALFQALASAIEIERAKRDKYEQVCSAHVHHEMRRDALGALFLQLAIADARPALVRSGKLWLPADDDTLRACWGSARRAAGGSEEALQSLADAVQRTPVAVALRLAHLGIWR